MTTPHFNSAEWCTFTWIYTPCALAHFESNFLIAFHIIEAILWVGLLLLTAVVQRRIPCWMIYYRMSQNNCYILIPDWAPYTHNDVCGKMCLYFKRKGILFSTIGLRKVPAAMTFSSTGINISTENIKTNFQLQRLLYLETHFLDTTWRIYSSSLFWNPTAELLWRQLLALI